MTTRWLVLLFLLTLAPAVSHAAKSGVKPGTLTGTVTDLDGVPLAGLPVWAIPPSESYAADDLPPSAFSGPDGSFAISGLPPGAIELHACGKGYRHDVQTVWFREEPVQVQLLPVAIVRGRVLGPDDRPVAGVRLYARESPMIIMEGDMIFTSSDGWPPCPAPLSATSGPDGRFELAALDSGRYRFEISAGGLIAEEAYRVQVSEGAVVDGLEIRLRSDGGREEPASEPSGEEPEEAEADGVSGSGAPSRPAAGAVLTGRARGLTTGDRGREVLARLDGDEDSFGEVPLQADNSFRFENVPPGSWEVTIQAAHLSAANTVVVKPRQRSVSVDVSFPRRAFVSGRVLDSAGRPLAGAEVSAAQDDEEVDRGGTRKDGSFALYVPQGDVHLTVIGMGAKVQESREVDVAVGRRAIKGLVIRLEPEPFTQVAGRLLGLAPGQEVEIVGILDEPTRTLYSRASFEGDRYTIPLDPGFWTLQGFLYDAAGTFLRRVGWTVDIPAGSTEKELDLDLASAKAIP